MRYLTLALLAGLVLLSTCNRYTADDLPTERVRFGSKGGFAGGERMYELLLDSGRLLFDDELTGELEKIGKLTPTELTEVREQLEDVDFAATPTGSTGNYTTSMTYYGSEPATTIRWVAPGGAPSPAVKTCYTTLMDAARRLRAEGR